MSYEFDIGDIVCFPEDPINRFVVIDKLKLSQNKILVKIDKIGLNNKNGYIGGWFNSNKISHIICHNIFKKNIVDSKYLYEHSYDKYAKKLRSILLSKGRCKNY